MKSCSTASLFAAVFFASQANALHAQERSVTLHTNFFYFGPIKEEFAAYPGGDGKLVRHGRYRDWEEGGALWHEIDYKDGRPHGAMITFHLNGRKASEIVYADGQFEGLVMTWNRDGEIVAQGTNRHGAHWNGTFALKAQHSVRSRGDEDTRYYISRFTNGVLAAGEPEESFDDGRKHKPPALPINYRKFLCWHRYSYDIKSSYPYLKQLPPWSEIPTVLEWVNSDRSDGGVQVAYSQLVALARADFGRSIPQLKEHSPAEPSNYFRIVWRESWARWWDKVGKIYPELLRGRGRQDSEAWKLVTPETVQPLPEYKVALPDEWVFKTTFRSSGNTEALTLRRTREKATLIRALRSGGRDPIKWEQWRPLSVEQADDFAFATAYAIDHPWLLKPKSKPSPGTRLEGRRYAYLYPRFEYELCDQDGNIWWNKDRWNWHGGEKTDDNFLIPSSTLGSVCLLVWRTFPEDSPANSSQPIAGAWRTMAMPNDTVLQQAAEDLELRGELISALAETQRPTVALEVLREFGTPGQLPAITRFQTDLASRLTAVESILVHVFNGTALRSDGERLLTAAALAAAEIQKRNAVRK